MKKDKKFLRGQEIELVIEDGETKARGVQNAAAKAKGADGFMAACAVTKVSAADAVNLMNDFFRETIEQRCRDIDVDTIIEMNAEKSIEKAIRSCVENGWGDHSIEKEVHRVVREMVSREVAENYTVEVDVRLVMK